MIATEIDITDAAEPLERAEVIVGEGEGPEGHLELLQYAVVFKPELDDGAMEGPSVQIVLDRGRWRERHDTPRLLEEGLIKFAFREKEVVFRGPEILHKIGPRNDQVPKSVGDALSDVLDDLCEQHRVELWNILQSNDCLGEALEL